MNEYDIALSDVKGVGPKTIELLNEADVTSADDLHLFHSGGMGGGSALSVLLDNGVSQRTIEHLRAVGDAVHYANSDWCKAKRLSGIDERGTRDVKILNGP